MFMSKLTQQAVSRMDYPVAETVFGKVRGIEKEGTFIFRGVPYAKAERFCFPENPDSWNGIKECLVYGCDAPLYQTNIARDQQELPHYYSPQSEDCQNLNIWTQHIDSSVKRPVIVWLHGGGFGGGSAVEQFAYDGEEMSARGDVVFVSPNFRLGSLGCLDLSSFGCKYSKTSLCGLADLVKALEWIKTNISFFGGDPGNVTLIGHAGGAPEVIALMQTPSADCLFHKVSMGSGLYHPVRPPEGKTMKDISSRLGALTAANLGLTSETIENIKNVPFWYLAQAAHDAEIQIARETGIERYPWGPIADGSYFLGYNSPEDIRSESLTKPIMLGIDMSDAAGSSRVRIGDCKKYSWDEETVKKHLFDMYGESAETISEEFKKAFPNKPLCDALYIDRKTRFTHFPFIDNIVGRGAVLYNWMFTLDFPINSGSSPMHCIENPFVTHNAEYFEATFMPGVTSDLQDKMCDAFLAFANSGSPQTDALPMWPTAEPGMLPTMIFDKEIYLAVNHDRRLQHIMEPWHVGSKYDLKK